MKALSVVFVCLFFSQHSLGYLSEGWQPGQAATKVASLGSGFNPSATHAGRPTLFDASKKEAEQNDKPISSSFDFSSYLEKQPIRGILERLGVNITDRLASARETAAKGIWNKEIPLITDANYQDMIVNEKMTELEAAERVWFLVITISSAQNEGISRFVDTQFDDAYAMTKEAGDLPDVKWGRIDYMNVTAITTKWGIWRAPYLVVLRNRGNELRFYKAHQLRMNPEVLREFLRTDAWLRTEPWQTAYAPGGSREFLLDYLSVVLTKIYDIMVLVPRWLMVLLSGGIASIAVNILHSGFWPFNRKEKKTEEPATVKTQATSTGTSTAVATGLKPTSLGGKSRKSGKK